MERLEVTGLPSMYYRRQRGDMIDCYKFTHNMYNSALCLDLDATSTLRGHSLKMKKHHTNKSVRKHFFSERVVNHWNALPEEVVSSPTLNTFKNRLDRHWKEYHYHLVPLPAKRLIYNEDTSNALETVENVVQA